MLTGMVNQDPRVQHLWQEVPCEGEVPTPEEFILWAAKKSLLAKKAGVRILFPAPVSMMVFRNTRKWTIYFLRDGGAATASTWHEEIKSMITPRVRSRELVGKPGFRCLSAFDPLWQIILSPA